MKKLNFEQMEGINGGISRHDAVELGCNIAVGAVGVVMASALGITILGLGLIASYATTVWAYYGCRLVAGGQ